MGWWITAPLFLTLKVELELEGGALDQEAWIDFFSGIGLFSSSRLSVKTIFPGLVILKGGFSGACGAFSTATARVVFASGSNGRSGQLADWFLGGGIATILSPINRAPEEFVPGLELVN
ncbi:MAG: hypothetical protein ACKO3V_10380 [Pirellula sp.]